MASVWLCPHISAAATPERAAPRLRIGPLQARFRFDAGAELIAPAGVAADGTLCVGTVDGYVHALNADGSYRWSYSLHGAINRRPLRVGDLWYVATSADRIYAFKPDGSLSWVFKPMSPVDSELAADTLGTLFFVAADHFLYGVSGHGAVVLRTPFGQLQAGPILGPDGAIWARNPTGLLRARGRLVARFAAEARHDVEFGEPGLLRDPRGRTFRARADGSVEFRATPSAEPRLLPLTRSPLLGPAWSTFAGYAVFSSRSGLVIALDPPSAGQSG